MEAYNGQRLGAATVALGPGARPETEIARFRDRRVSVEGRLVLQPPSDPETAGPRPLPTLFDPSEPSFAE